MATQTANINYLQPTSFKLVIDRKNYPNLEFFCQSVSHPGMTMSSVEVSYQKIAGIPFPGDTLSFTDLTCQIILDEDMNSYTEMFNWLRRNLDNTVLNPLDRIATSPSTYTDITLSILSSHNNQVRQIKYVDALPTAIGDINFESTGDGSTYLTFSATFRFSYFELLGTNANTGSINPSLQTSTLLDGSSRLTSTIYDSA
jgi:hypothetical protein